MEVVLHPKPKSSMKAMCKIQKLDNDLAMHFLGEIKGQGFLFSMEKCFSTSYGKMRNFDYALNSVFNDNEWVKRVYKCLSYFTPIFHSNKSALVQPLLSLCVH